MTIETKYNIGDKVWVDCFGEAVSFKVKAINIHKDKFHSSILYDLLEDDEAAFIRLPESDLFPTKEGLLKSL